MISAQPLEFLRADKSVFAVLKIIHCKTNSAHGFHEISRAVFPQAQQNTLPTPVALCETQKLRFAHQTQDLCDALSKSC